MSETQEKVEKQIFEDDKLKLEYLKNRNLAIVTFMGELSFSTVSSANKLIKPIVEQVKSQGLYTHLVLDLVNVNFLDSSGIGFVTGKFISLKREGKMLVLCGLNRKVADCLGATQLSKVLQVYDDRRHVVANLLKK